MKKDLSTPKNAGTSYTYPAYVKQVCMLLIIVIGIGCKNKTGTELVEINDSTAEGLIIRDTVNKFHVNEGVSIGSSAITFDSIKYSHKVINVFGKNKFLVEGDLLMDSAEYFQYQLGLALNRPKVKSGKQQAQPNLVIETDGNGNVLKWKGDKVITYSIIRRSFPTENAYQEVKKNFDSACNQWSAISGVRFMHNVAADENAITSPSPELTFIVCAFDADGDFIAQAFFPNTERMERRVLVDPSYFSSPFNKTGVFRHELGHVLGFRHEHIRSGAPAVCPKETRAGTINLGKYDPRSVMHYFCGQMGDINLKFTNWDKLGTAKIYRNQALYDKGIAD